MVVANLKTDPDALERRVWQRLEQVLDPEIPVLSIVDLGIVRGVETTSDSITIALSPTYSGCPATEVIEASVVAALEEEGFGDVRIRRELAPAWTTDWISAAGREKLLAYGIAPPAQGVASSKKGLFGTEAAIHCPRCRSQSTTKISEFGSTPCKASYRCEQCLEPFEYFKCI